MGEAVADKSELAFLDILLDGVPRATMSVCDVLVSARAVCGIQEFVFGDLSRCVSVALG